MNSFAIKAASRQILIWGALALIAMFLTISFSFLGTISSAVIVAMMMGATGSFRWQAIPISLVFPAVAIVLAYWFKHDLVWGKIHLLSWLCIVSFWLIYLITLGLMLIEKPTQVPAPLQARAPSAPARPAPSQAKAAHRSAPSQEVASLDPSALWSMKAVSYWMATLVVSFELGLGGLCEVFGIPYLHSTITRLGYPEYFAFLLGLWKLLGALTLLLPGLARMKEWAYAGAVFCYTGAVASHFTMGDTTAAIWPIILAALALSSWALRPLGRTLEAPPIPALPAIRPSPGLVPQQDAIPSSSSQIPVPLGK